MTRGGPSFDDLVGPEVSGDERERLRRAHELLLAAGPPPELSPGLAAGPAPGATLVRRRPRRRPVYLLAAAVVTAAVAFLGGYLAGHGSGGAGSGQVAAVWTLQLRGTAVAPHALASLHVLPARAGNWPMTLRVTGLPALPADGYYEVYLVRSGEPWASCGAFVVRNASTATTVTLNAPYRLDAGDSWVVTRQGWNSESPGRTVLEPVT